MKEPFQIMRVNDKIAKKIAKVPAHQPHIHDYEEIIVVIKGTVEHFIDFESTVLQGPFVSFVTKGKSHRIKPIFDAGESDGFAIRFQSEFVTETIFQLYHFFHEDANIFFSNPPEFQRFITLCEMLHEEAHQETSNYVVMRSLLNTLITILEVEKRKSLENNIASKQNKSFIKLLQLLEENYRLPVSASFYAKKLFMSSRNLNLICNQIVQKSISEIIQTRKLIEAKKLLTSTNKPVYEIGFELGFKEQAYFSSVFKKKTGQTPSEFRKEAKLLFEPLDNFV